MNGMKSIEFLLNGASEAQTKQTFFLFVALAAIKEESLWVMGGAPLPRLNSIQLISPNQSHFIILASHLSFRN